MQTTALLVEHADDHVIGWTCRRPRYWLNMQMIKLLIEHSDYDAIGWTANDQAVSWTRRWTPYWLNMQMNTLIMVHGLCLSVFISCIPCKCPRYWYIQFAFVNVNIIYIQFVSAVAQDLLKCTLTSYIYGYVLGLMIWSIVTLSCCRIIHNLKCHRLKIKLNDCFILRIEMTFGVQNQKNV